MPSRSRTYNYVAGIITGYASSIATIVVGLWLTPFTFRYLDREAYGIASLGSSVIVWLSLFDIGITAGLNVHLAQSSSNMNMDEINRLTSSTFFAQLVIALLALIVGIAIAFGFPAFFEVSPNLQHDSVVMVCLLAVGMAINLSTRTFSALLVAMQQMHVDNLLSLALIFIRTILTVAMLTAGWGILSITLANLVATVITSSLAVLRAFRAVPGLKILARLVSLEDFKKVARVGVWFALGGLAGIVILNVDQIVIAKIVSLEAVTTFAITGRLYNLSQGFLNRITETARPALGQMMGQGNMDTAVRTYRQLFALSTGLSVAVAFAIWAGNRAFVTAWVGEANYGGGTLDLAFALNLLANTWILPNRAALSAGLVVRQQTLSRLLEATINLGLSILLTMRFGIVGAAISTAFAAFVTSFFYLPLLTARMFQRSFKEFLLRDSVPPLLAALCIFPVAALARIGATAVGGVVGSAAAALLTIVAGIAIVWGLVLGNDLRRRFRSAILQTVRSSNVGPGR